MVVVGHVGGVRSRRSGLIEEAAKRRKRATAMKKIMVVVVVVVVTVTAEAERWDGSGYGGWWVGECRSSFHLQRQD